MTDLARSDVYPPEVEAIGEMATCSDELHAHGCPCGVGGDAIERCWWCRRRDVDRNVSLSDGRIVGCCDTCWTRGEEAVLIPLSYEDDDGD